MQHLVNQCYIKLFKTFYVGVFIFLLVLQLNQEKTMTIFNTYKQCKSTVERHRIDRAMYVL